MAACTRCGLQTRTNVVFGEGNPRARLMFIGEGPGRDEDLLGRPFVGAAGLLLDKMMASIGFNRNTVYIANIVKCRPPGNRDPQPDEAAACIGYLRSQVAIIKPKIIVCLGRISARYILGTDIRITRDRGVWREVKAFGYCPPTIRPRCCQRSTEKDAWRDLLAIRAKYDEICNGDAHES